MNRGLRPLHCTRSRRPPTPVTTVRAAATHPLEIRPPRDPQSTRACLSSKRSRSSVSALIYAALVSLSSSFAPATKHEAYCSHATEQAGPDLRQQKGAPHAQGSVRCRRPSGRPHHDQRSVADVLAELKETNSQRLDEIAKELRSLNEKVGKIPFTG